MIFKGILWRLVLIPATILYYVPVIVGWLMFHFVLSLVMLALLVLNPSLCGRLDTWWDRKMWTVFQPPTPLRNKLITYFHES